MKRSLLLALLTLALGACQPPPDVYLADGSGARWADWQGRWLVINYWAEWCAPCRKEIPELNELNHEEEILVLGVNYDGLVGDKLTTLMSEMDVQFPVLVEDPRERWAVEQPQVLPATLIVDPGGALKEVIVGPQTLASLKASIASHGGD